MDALQIKLLRTTIELYELTPDKEEFSIRTTIELYELTPDKEEFSIRTNSYRKRSSFLDEFRSKLAEFEAQYQLELDDAFRTRTGGAT